jgi:hypothetical protein
VIVWGLMTCTFCVICACATATLLHIFLHPVICTSCVLCISTNGHNCRAPH